MGKRSKKRTKNKNNGGSHSKTKADNPNPLASFDGLSLPTDAITQYLQAETGASAAMARSALAAAAGSVEDELRELSIAVDANLLDQTDELCAAEYLRMLPEGLTTVSVEIVELQEALLRLAKVSQQELDAAIARQKAEASGNALQGRDDVASEQPASQGAITEVDVDGDPADLDADSGTKSAAIVSGIRLTLAEELDSLEQAILGSLPPEIIEKIYATFDSEGCRCPAGCTGLLHLQDFEQHCLDHLEHEIQEEERAQAQALQAKAHQHALPQAGAVQAPPVATTTAEVTAPAPIPAPTDSDEEEDGELERHATAPLTSCQPACSTTEPPGSDQPATCPTCSGHLPQQAMANPPVPSSPATPLSPLALGADSSYDALGEDNYDNIFNFVNDYDPWRIPEINEEGDNLVLRIPPAPPNRTEDQEDEALEAVLEWLYYDVGEGASDRWANLFSIFRGVHKRIAALNPLIDAKEQVLRIRGKVAADYQRKLATMAPAPDTESQRMRMHMVEVLCLATVIDNYLEITRRRIAVFQADSDRFSTLAKQVQENIIELNRQISAHDAEIDRLDANELKLLKEEFDAIHDGKGKNRKKALKTLDSDKHRVAKDDLIKKIDSAKQRIVELKEKYAKTLQMLVTTKQKLSDQQRMEQALARLQEQCHVVLDGHEQRGEDGQPIRPLSSIDLQPIIAFEKQEADDLDRLMEEHSDKMEKRAHLFEVMRDSSYTDPILKVIKEAILEKLERMAHAARLRQAQLALLEEESKKLKREALTKSLLETEALEQAKAAEARRLKEEEIARRLEKKQMERAKALEAERQKQLDAEKAKRKAEQAAKAKKDAERRKREAELKRELATTPTSTRRKATIGMAEQGGDTKRKEKRQETRAAASRRPKAEPEPELVEQPVDETVVRKSRSLCRDFLRGSCPRGDNCSWLHVKGTIDSQPLCKDFQRGVCHRKPCAFLHLSPKEAAALRSMPNATESSSESPEAAKEEPILHSRVDKPTQQPRQATLPNPSPPIASTAPSAAPPVTPSVLPPAAQGTGQSAPARAWSTRRTAAEVVAHGPITGSEDAFPALENTVVSATTTAFAEPDEPLIKPALQFMSQDDASSATYPSSKKILTEARSAPSTAAHPSLLAKLQGGEDLGRDPPDGSEAAPRQPFVPFSDSTAPQAYGQSSHFFGPSSHHFGPNHGPPMMEYRDEPGVPYSGRQQHNPGPRYNVNGPHFGYPSAHHGRQGEHFMNRPHEPLAPQRQFPPQQAYFPPSPMYPAPQTMHGGQGYHPSYGDSYGYLSPRKEADFLAQAQQARAFETPSVPSMPLFQQDWLEAPGDSSRASSSRSSPMKSAWEPSPHFLGNQSFPTTPDRFDAAQRLATEVATTPNDEQLDQQMEAQAAFLLQD